MINQLNKRKMMLTLISNRNLFIILIFVFFNKVYSQIYGSSKDIFDQLNSRTYPQFSEMTNYPYYLSEEAIIGYDTPSLKEDIYKSQDIKSKRDIDNSFFKDFHKQKEEFLEIEKDRRRNQESYKEFIKYPKNKYKKDHGGKKLVKEMLEDQKKVVDKNNKSIHSDLIRKVESPINAKKSNHSPIIEESNIVDQTIFKYHLRNNNLKRIHYGASDANHLSYYYDVNANCYWVRSEFTSKCITYEEIYSKHKIDPTSNVAFDSSLYHKLPQEYGNDKECVATYRDPKTRRRICIKQGEYFDNLKKGPNRNGLLIWHPERSKHSVEVDTFSEEYFRN